MKRWQAVRDLIKIVGDFFWDFDPEELVDFYWSHCRDDG